MNDYYLVVDFSPTHYCLGLSRNGSLIAYKSQEKRAVSRDFLSLLQQLLQEHTITLSQLTFIACTQGPGPFTTLRALLATVNGLQFATNIPLIGSNTLENIIDAYDDPTWQGITVALLNACNNDVYYAIAQQQNPLMIGCHNIDAFLQQLLQQYTVPIRFIGYGVTIYKKNIDTALGKNSYYLPELPEEKLLVTMSLKAYQAWMNHETVGQLLPIYLKTLSYKQSNL